MKEKFYIWESGEINVDFVYSAKQFEKVLNDELAGETIQKILVGTDPYNDVIKGDNFLDFHRMGRTILFLLDSKILRLEADARGLMQYGIVPVDTINFETAETYNKKLLDTQFFDISDEFTLKYERQKIKNVSVSKEKAYPFYLEGFDEQRGNTAANKFDLPACIYFLLENDNTFEVIGDINEYYSLCVQSPEDIEKDQNDFMNALMRIPPDYATANGILSGGLDINAHVVNDAENMLSYMFWGHEKGFTDDGDEYRNKKCYLLDIINYMLDRGFDLTKDGGKYGAMCLSNLTYCSRDENVVYAGKLLLDKGAKNIELDEYDGTPSGRIGTEASYLSACLDDLHTANIYEALYRVIDFAEQGKDYHGIDVYFTAKGKTIKRVLKGKEERGIFDINYEQSKHKNCFVCSIYFDLDGIYLSVNEYCELVCYEKIYEETEDISPLFGKFIGRTITSFEFDKKGIMKTTKQGKTHYGQPVDIIGMDDGSQIIFTCNHGEQPDDYAGYFTLNDGNKN